MPMNTLGNCNKIMQVAKDRGFEKEMIWADLKDIIRMTVGSRDDTVKRYLHELVEFGFLVNKSQGVFFVVKHKVEAL